jgi:hypothetical protein
MKRILIGIGLVAVLAFAALALGSVRHYKGPVDQGGRVKFDTRVDQGKVKAVKRFYFFDLPLTCERSPRHVLISNRRPLNFPFPTMKVKAREFHGDFSNSDFHTRGHVEGQFNRHFTKAAGTLRVQGHPFGAQNKCDTGTDDWHAHRTG